MYLMLIELFYLQWDVSANMPSKYHNLEYKFEDLRSLRRLPNLRNRYKYMYFL